MKGGATVNPPSDGERSQNQAMTEPHRVSARWVAELGVGRENEVSRDGSMVDASQTRIDVAVSSWLKIPAT